MTRSRLTSLLVATILGFHLQMGAADLACEAGIMKGSADAMAGMTMPGDGGAPVDADQKEAPCKSPGAAAACNLMAPCVTGVFESVRERAASPAVHSLLPKQVVVLIPTSRSFPPEPPPPRA